MADNELIITLTLEDKVSQGLVKTSKSLEQFQRSAKELGRELSQVGNTMAFFGAGITAPFILAMKSASETSFELSNQFKSLDTITKQFNTTIATALVPIVETFVDKLNELLQWFNSLDKGMRDAIIQAVFLSGVFITFGGIILSLTGKVVGLVSNLSGLLGTFLGFVAVNPIILAVAVAVAGLIFLMLKFKPIADIVLNTFEVLFTFLKNGFLTIKYSFEIVIADMLDVLVRFQNVIGKIPSVLGEVVREFSGQIAETSRSLRAMAEQDLVLVGKNIEAVGQIMSGEQGDWAKNWEDIKKNMTDYFDNFLEKGTDTINKMSFWEKKGLDIAKKVHEDKIGSLRTTLEQAANLNKTFANAYKAVAIGEAAMSTAAGIALALKTYPFPYSLIVGGLIGAAGAVQIAAIASQKFANGGIVGGSSTSGDNTLVRANAGEMFLNNGQQANLFAMANGRGGGGGDITINLFDAHFNNDADARRFTEMIGFEVERKARNARSIV